MGGLPINKKVVIFIFTFIFCNIGWGKPLIEDQAIGIDRYRPIYFLYGVPTSKLQISFKYRPLEEIPLYATYTQLAFWELLSDSVPFRDVNYNPEFFYRLKIESGLLDSLDMGYEHLSNGAPRTTSRSLDRIFAELHMQAATNGGTWEFSLRGRQPLKRDEDTADYDRYAGGTLLLQGRLTQVFDGIFDQGSVYFKISPGGRWLEELKYGSQEVGFSFRLNGLRLAPAIFIQYFHGFAESMISYKEEEQNLRIGILL